MQTATIKDIINMIIINIIKTIDTTNISNNTAEAPA
jgi:hypothetical protein